jgi:hypothetical protein
MSVSSIEVAHANAAIMGPLAVELAAQSAALDQLEHRLQLRPARLIPFRRGEAVESDRHRPDHDRIAVANDGDPPVKVPRGHGAAAAAVVAVTSSASTSRWRMSAGIARQPSARDGCLCRLPSTTRETEAHRRLTPRACALASVGAGVAEGQSGCFVISKTDGSNPPSGVNKPVALATPEAGIPA